MCAEPGLPHAVPVARDHPGRLDASPAPPGTRRRRRRDRRRRLHRSLDGATTSPRRPVAAGRRARGARSPASARPAATAAGAPRCSRPRSSRWPSARHATDALASHAAMRAHRRRGDASRPTAEGIDAHIDQGRHHLAGPHRGRSGRGPGPRSRDAREWGRGEDELRLLDARGGDGRPGAAPTSAARRTPRTARPSTPAASSAAWPTPSNAAASRSTSRRRVTAIAPGRVDHATRDRARRAT